MHGVAKSNQKTEFLVDVTTANTAAVVPEIVHGKVRDGFGANSGVFDKRIPPVHFHIVGDLFHSSISRRTENDERCNVKKCTYKNKPGVGVVLGHT